MTNPIPLNEYLADSLEELAPLVPVIISYFHDYIGHLHDTADCSFQEYLDDLNQGKLCIAFEKVVDKGMSIGFSIETSLMGRMKVSDCDSTWVEIDV